MIYIDPPFGTGDEYEGNKGQKGYSAKSKGAEFVEFIRRRLIVAKDILSDDGVIMVRQGYNFGHYIKVILDEIFGKSNLINEIVVNRGKQRLGGSKKYSTATDTLYFYSKTSAYNFYPFKRERYANEAKGTNLLMKGERNPPERIFIDPKGNVVTLLPPTNQHWKFIQDKIDILYKKDVMYLAKSRNGLKSGIKKITKDGSIVPVDYVPSFKFDDDKTIDANWSDISGYAQLTGYPTENSETLLERVIQTSTIEGDIVLDFFSGSGTTAAVAEKLNRKWITCDIGKLSFYTVQKRILNIKKSKSIENPKRNYSKQAKSFLTVNTGQYDLEKVFNLKSTEYSNFVLNLFEIEPIKKTISGIKINGQRKDGYYALIWPYWKFKDASVDEEYLHNLHSNIGKKVGDRIYIVAPASYVDFISDYYEIDKVRYYFLKVPYHIIKELHKIQFKRFRQPQSKKNVNDLEDAIGFHFMKQPEVETEVTVLGKDVKISIKKFLSDFSEDDKGKELENLESLAMVLIDKDFDGNAFDMDEYYFAEDLLPKKKGKADDDNIGEELKKTNVINLSVIPKKECGKNLMIIYVDIYGNEFKEKFEIK